MAGPHRADRRGRLRLFYGWFVATVVSDAVGKKDKKKTPTATHVVEYKQKETGLRSLVGKEAQTLTVDKYGPTEWWIVLDEI